MRNLLLVVFALLLGALSVEGQQKNPKAELYGGYSFVHLDDDIDARNVNGWQLSVNSGFPRKFGFEIAADFSGHYGKFDMHTATVGPRFLGRFKSFTFYSHFMYGMAQIRGDLKSTKLMTNKRSETSFANSIGLGIDIQVNERVALCPFRYDVILSNWGDKQSQLHLRYSSGLVFRFGKK